MSASAMAIGSDRDYQLDVVFRALAHRTRRALLARLAEGSRTITELAEPESMTLPAVSKHLKVLERAGLIVRDIDGRVHRCSLGPEPLRDVQQWLDHYRQFWDESLDSLARYVESDDP
jgi:DNA-binding transcriptional ArsR family regulator